MAVTRNKEDQPWWADGLPFSCQQSGRCCHRRGDIGYVYVNYRERKALAEQLSLSVAEFTKRFTVAEDDGARVLRFEEGRCVFLDGVSCQVHSSKPVQCRTWPFWQEVLASEETYEKEVRSMCPGSRQGPLVPAAEISRQLEETEQALWEV
ncbi:MAG: YkgJ family cysteine cluster protein [Planctomycetes bacterium]|nr:YkgJ family cysteine cluster protein [Planctomycetota bacterium]